MIKKFAVMLMCFSFGLVTVAGCGDKKPADGAAAPADDAAAPADDAAAPADDAAAPAEGSGE